MCERAEAKAELVAPASAAATKRRWSAEMRGGGALARGVRRDARTDRGSTARSGRGGGRFDMGREHKMLQ